MASDYRRPVYRYNDAPAALAAAKAYGHALKNTAPSLRANRDVVLAAVKKNGYALGYAHEDLRGDKKVGHNGVAQAHIYLEPLSIHPLGPTLNDRWSWRR